MQHLLVVGASRGLGLALVELALERGARVTALARSDSERLTAMQAEQPGRLSVIKADVRSEEQLRRAAQRLDPDCHFDCLMYNAATHLEKQRDDIEDSAIDDLLETLDVNAVGAARVVKHFRRFLEARGLLVFISSEAGSIADAKRQSEYGYCMSKAALNMLAKLLSQREAAREGGAQVIAVHPGWVRTDMGGPRAELSPTESADAILRTLDARRARGGALFVDRHGQPMAF